MKMKALVVDNNAVILKVLSYTLQKRGLEVETAADGLSALNTLQHFHPDIIFTDLIMPNIDGENLCRIIRKRDDLPTPLLIIVSAMAVEEDLDFVDFGAHACIAKGPASTMAASIDSILSHLADGKIDLLKGKRLGTETLVPRSIAQELAEAKHHYKRIFDNIDNGIIEFSNQGTIVHCNAYTLDFFNCDLTEILSINLPDLFTGDAKKHVTECLKRFTQSQSSVESVRAIHVHDRIAVFKLIRISETESSTAIMIMRDITNEFHARQKLNYHLQQLENIVDERTKKYEEANNKLQDKISEVKFIAKQWSNTFDTIPDFVSIHDKEMRFVRVNKALADFLGSDPKELIGRHCYEVMHGLNRPWPNCPHVAAMKTGETASFVVVDDYINIPLQVTCTPLFSDDGDLMGSVHVARDISEQQKAEATRENLINQLQDSLAKVKVLSGFIPICASCKKIRDDSGYWKQVEEYIRDHSEAEFSHSICPTCAKRFYSEFIDEE